MSNQSNGLVLAGPGRGHGAGRGTGRRNPPPALAAVSAHPLMSRSSDTGVLFCFEFGDSELIPDQAHIIAVIKIFIFKR